MTCRRVSTAIVSVACVLFAAATFAGDLPRSATRSFAFPAALADGLVGDLVTPANNTSHLSVGDGHVAIGRLPIPMPERGGRRGRLRRGRDLFMRPTDEPPHVRLLLRGVVDANGNAVSSQGNHLVISAVVTPEVAASTASPFSFGFDLADGNAFVDAPLPIHPLADAAVKVQILAVSVVDPDEQTFAVLGFELVAAPIEPTPVVTPSASGQCFIGPRCAGPSFQASRERCCHFTHGDTQPLDITSWCPVDQLDPASGRCAADACAACGPLPPPLTCGEREECSGACQVQCEDGHTTSGVCQGDLTCRCSATCASPPPTPEPCGARNVCGGPCMLVCPDGSAAAGVCGDHLRHHEQGGCACIAQCAPPPTIPPPPHGRICCQCAEPLRACFEIPFVEVEPICPRGCRTVINGDCDEQSHSCVPPKLCTSDHDCDDGNGCTIDHCSEGSCSHDCVCVGPFGCRPGPGVDVHLGPSQ